MPVTIPTGNALLDQHRSLLDMELEETADALGRELRLAGADAIRREARLGHVLGQGAAGIGAPAAVQRLGLEQSERRAAADIRRGKPRQLLGPHAHHGDVALRRAPRPPPARQHRHAGHDAGGAVIVAALRHRIEMRAGHDRRQRPVASRQGEVEIARRVEPLLERQVAADAAHQVVRHLLAFAVGRPRHAQPALRMLPQMIEPLPGKRHLRLEVQM